MPAETYGQEYRAENLTSRYPFADSATLVTRDGYTVGVDWFYDATVGPFVAVAAVELTSIITATGAATLWVGDVDVPKRASASFDPTAPPPLVSLKDTAGRPSGLLVLNQQAVSALQSWTAAEHRFSEGAAAFAVSTIVPAGPAGLLGIADGNGNTLTDEVWLIGEAGVVLTGDATANTIRIDIVGDPLNARRACVTGAAGPGSTPSGNFITPGRLRRINYTMPNAYGGYVFTPFSATRGETILRITTEGEDTLVFSLAGPSSAAGG